MHIATVQIFKDKWVILDIYLQPGLYYPLHYIIMGLVLSSVSHYVHYPMSHVNNYYHHQVVTLNA